MVCSKRTGLRRRMVPDYAVVGGVPAKVIRMLDPKEQKE